MHSPRVTLGFTFNRRRPNLLIRNSTAKPCVHYKVAEVLARGIVEDVKRGDVHLVSPVPLPSGFGVTVSFQMQMACAQNPQCETTYAPSSRTFVCPLVALHLLEPFRPWRCVFKTRPRHSATPTNDFMSRNPQWNRFRLPPDSPTVALFLLMSRRVTASRCLVRRTGNSSLAFRAETFRT